jgi:L-cystine uptake protein TcyP (sodium:dicarboxylate symporter family)
MVIASFGAAYAAGRAAMDVSAKDRALAIPIVLASRVIAIDPLGKGASGEAEAVKVI